MVIFMCMVISLGLCKQKEPTKCCFEKNGITQGSHCATQCGGNILLLISTTHGFPTPTPSPCHQSVVIAAIPTVGHKPPCFVTEFYKSYSHFFWGWEQKFVSLGLLLSPCSPQKRNSWDHLSVHMGYLNSGSAVTCLSVSRVMLSLLCS